MLSLPATRRRGVARRPRPHARLRRALAPVAGAAALLTGPSPGALAAQGSVPGVPDLPAPGPARLASGTRRGEPRAYGGLALSVAQPVHEFYQYVRNGVGVAGHGFYRLGGDGAFALRADGGFVTYGRERRSVDLYFGGGNDGELTTTNNIYWLGVGPQLVAPQGPVRPYANASVGVALFSTTTTLRERRFLDEDRELADRVEASDFTWAAGAGGGVLVPLSRGPRHLTFLDLGARYHRNGRVRYLRRGGITELPDGGTRLDLIESRADLWTFQLGFAFGGR
jgi:hypothetical protein